MSGILWKTFNLCFSKFKCFPTITYPPPPAAEPDHHHNLPATTTTPALFKNFNSLYDAPAYSDTSTSKSLTFSSSTAAAADEDFLSSSSDASDDEVVPDFTSAFASHRFFFSSPGSSNSIFQPPEPPCSGKVVTGGVAVQTFSPDPYSDFRNSMLEMIETQRFRKVPDSEDVKFSADWEFLNELLLCYLTLNPKHTHKFIVKAFADVVVSLVSPPALLTEAGGDTGDQAHLQRQSATSCLMI